MDWNLLQSIILALVTGWIGYVVAGRRWRQQERRTLYRDYLIAAREALKSLNEFEADWNEAPESMSVNLYFDLVSKAEKLDSLAQELSLIAPSRVHNSAYSIPSAIHDLLTEIVYIEDDDTYETRNPPSYEWFHSRRTVYFWGPDMNDLNEFLNLARADLGAQSPFWRIRGERTSYRKGFPDWLKWSLAPRFPVIGPKIMQWNMKKHEELRRRSDEQWKATREQRRNAARSYREQSEPDDLQ